MGRCSGHAHKGRLLAGPLRGHVDGTVHCGRETFVGAGTARETGIAGQTNAFQEHAYGNGKVTTAGREARQRWMRSPEPHRRERGIPFWIGRLAVAGVLPSDPDEVRLRKAGLTLSCVLLNVLALIWAVAYIALGLPLAGVVPLTFIVASAIGLLYFLRTKRYSLFRFSQLAMMLLLPFLMQVALGGFHSSSGVVLWAFTVPLSALVFYGPRRSAQWFLVYLVLVVASAVADSSLIVEGRHLPSTVIVTFFILNIGGVSVSAYLLLHYFVRERERAKAALDEKHRLLVAEQERSERLLLNILPGPVAQRLKENDGIIADRLPEVSVLFADIVGFTQIAQRVSADQVVELLNNLFSAFDRLVERHGVEKIKTIGDSYMAAAGVPTPRVDHARAIAEMALDMREVVLGHADDSGKPLAVRIGIDTGPVVAGVIGRKKFIYDLWGEAVNTASRMESSGLPGQIQVTDRTYQQLRHLYLFQERASVRVKGMGEMTTYLLCGRRADASQRALGGIVWSGPPL